MFVFAAVFFTVLLVAIVLLFAYLKKRTSTKRLIPDIQGELNEILAGIDRVTERDIQLIEERENRLKSLLAETDRRIKTLTKELDRRKAAEQTYAELGRKRRLAVQTAAPELSPPAPFAPAPVEEPPPQKETAPPSLGDKARELRADGLSARDIASRLGVSIAEVELVLALSPDGHR
ncbi:MAG: hypothetical protein MdMp014T_0828 [Treponematales bacterium]